MVISMLSVTLPTTARQVARGELGQEPFVIVAHSVRTNKNAACESSALWHSNHPSHCATSFLLRPWPAGCRPACPVPLQTRDERGRELQSCRTASLRRVAQGHSCRSSKEDAGQKTTPQQPLQRLRPPSPQLHGASGASQTSVNSATST